MEASIIVTLAGLLLNIVLAIINLLNTKKLETLKRKYDYVNIKYDRLVRIKEDFSKINISYSSFDLIQEAKLGKGIVDKLVQLKNELENASSKAITLLLLNMHLFNEKQQGLIKEKISNKNTTDEGIKEQVLDSSEGDDQNLLRESMIKLMQNNQDFIDYFISTIETELNTITKGFIK